MLQSCEVLVIGGGPAGLAAALNAASEGLTTTVLVKDSQLGGQSASSADIENYPGFPQGISGPTLAEDMKAQGRKFGARFRTSAEVIDLRYDGEQIVATCDDDSQYACKATIVASGIHYRSLDAPGVTRFLGRGVEYGMNPMQARRMRGKTVAVVGGANSAGQAAVHFASHGAKVIVLARSPIEATMSSYLLAQIAKLPVEVLIGRVAAVNGETVLSSVTLATASTVEHIPVDALHIFIGAEPQTDWLSVDKDAHGFVSTGIAPGALYLETSLPGVFAAGDIRAGSIKRVAAAVGEGSMAVQFVHRYLEVRP